MSTSGLQYSVVENIHSRNDSAARHLQKISALGLLGVLDFIPISLYQLGVIKHLPDPPGKIFHSDKVNAAKEAKILGLPDGPVSLLMYAANIVLAGALLSRTSKPTILKYLLAGISIGQAVGGAYYLTNMIRVQKKICPYCVAGALINFATLLPLKKFFNLHRDSSRAKTGSLANTTSGRYSTADAS